MSSLDIATVFCSVPVVQKLYFGFENCVLCQTKPFKKHADLSKQSPHLVLFFFVLFSLPGVLIVQKDALFH